VSAEFRCLRVLIGDADETSAALAGRKVVAVRRHGKFIEMELDGGRSFVVHLGMTGKLLMNAVPGRHTHAILTLDRGALLYDDSRQFGRLELSAGLPARVRKLGPEPLEVSFEDFALRVREHKTKIKALLLNQRFLRGIGNIYADEALFRAGIHPLAVARRLRRDRLKKLHAAIRKVLGEAIEAGGSSVSDYVDVDGRQGSFQVRHNVYQKAGESCPRCGTAIRRILVTQRGTHFCPGCQKR
jgi:formamidopyrimidine-DNA glycosylase